MAKFHVKQIRSLSVILTSTEIEGQLNKILDRVEANASRDPNREYVKSFRRQIFRSRGSGRVADRKIGQFGAAPGVGTAVEARRGTMARALREA